MEEEKKKIGRPLGKKIFPNKTYLRQNLASMPEATAKLLVELLQKIKSTT